MQARVWRAILATTVGLPLLSAVPLTASAASGSRLSKADIARLSTNVNQRVIVLMANQHPELPTLGLTAPARAATLGAEQAPITDELRQVAARDVKTYRTINAVAAVVSQAETDRLKANPAVAQVLPDLVVQGPKRSQDQPVAGAARPGASAAAPPATICPSDPSKPLLEPEALQLTNTAFNDPSVPQAQNKFDGSGVKVAFIADGIDINNQDFIRANGQHVFVDYQDFSGDGPNAPSPGAEAFGDASSIAAQGLHPYDLSNFVNPAHPLPPGCNITVRGMAPGASLVGLKAFGNSNNAFTSGLLEAIDWAVNVDHVDVLNESFGANPYPDTENDPITLFDQMAVAAGVAVVGSTGDAGPTGTTGSPATNSGNSEIISAGATTQFRSYAQTTMAGFQLSKGTWTNDNISALSSGGFNQLDGKSLDLAAPGDLGWALCSTNRTLYTACGDNKGAPTPIQLFGGTSESAPLTSGAAALAIQAYRTTHGGWNPTPAEVKQILTGSADDLGAPAFEQGAGLLDSLKATQAAQGLPDAHGGTPTGSTLVTSPTALSAVANPNQSEALPLKVTNTGSTTQTINAHIRALTTQVSDDKGSVQLQVATDPTFIDQAGRARAFVTKTFAVPAGADRLDASISWPGNGATLVRLTLIDPQGRFTAYSLPQGVANFAHVDVNHPPFGQWTAVIWTAASAAGFSGPVHFDFATSRYQTVGSVTPPSLTLAPGATGTFTVVTATPAQPGDMSEAVELDGPFRQVSTVPITLRSLIPTTSNGGSFAGDLTGGNGRAPFTGQTVTYQFQIPAGMSDVGANLRLANDPGYPIFAYLVDPQGETLGQTSNTNVDSAGNQTFTKTLQMFHMTPSSGRWTLVLVEAGPISGNRTSEPFTGKITFNTVSVQASGVPASPATVLPRGVPTTAKIRVSNTGNTPENFFVDGRLNKVADLNLVPTPVAGVPAAFTVPTETSTLIGETAANVPMEFDMSPITQDLVGFVGDQNDPDVESSVFPNNVAMARLDAPEITYGQWGMFVQQIGPFGAAGQPPGTFNAAMVAHGQKFDPAVTSSTGDVWLRTVDAHAPAATLITIAPGHSAVITVTITPSAPKGTVVSGNLYVDDFSSTMASGDEWKAIPYSYTVG